MKFDPMLASRLKHTQLPKYLVDDDFWFERKLDGVRQVIVSDAGHVTAWGRVNEAAPNRDIAGVLGQLNGRWVFDGELVGGVFWCFDLLVTAGNINITEKSPYTDRRHALDTIAPTLAAHTEKFRVLPTARTQDEKEALYVECRKMNYEGIMVKHRNGMYYPGRRSPKMLKAKFIETIDCVVDEVNRQGKRSIGISLYEDGKLVNVGACTVLNDKKRNAINVGDVVELEYLYATDDRKIYQPAFKKVRTDKAAADCGFEQMKFTDKQVVG